jgi:hypothetical protein
MQQVSEATHLLLKRLFDLSTKTSWFFHNDHNAEIATVLEQVAQQGEPGAISVVISYLFSPSAEVRIAASRTVHSLLDRLPPERLRHLGDMFSESSGWFIGHEWERLTPAGAHSLITEASTRTSVVGLLSFHRNGYVRHEAVRLLAQSHDASELPYVLIRQNDWVEPIRSDARRAVEARLDEGHLSDFVTNLSLVIHLLAFQRQDNADVVRRVIGMLVQRKHDKLLAQAIHSPDPTVRRSVVRLALDAEGEHRRWVVEHAMASTDSIIRLWGSRHVRPCFSGKALEGILKSLRRDRFMPVRREALIVEADTSRDSGRGVWRQALLDRNVSIRELARFHLGKLDEVDWPEVYRRALIEHPQSLAALGGLGETGDRSDLITIRGWLDSPLPSRRRAAVRAFAKVGGESALPDLLKYIQDESPAVIREVRKHLEISPSSLDGERLYRVAMEDHRGHVRETALRLINAMGKWGSLPWLVRASVQPDRSTGELAQRLVEAWFTPGACNRVFTTPARHERQAIIEALDDSRQEMDETFQRKLDLWLKDSRLALIG